MNPKLKAHTHSHFLRYLSYAPLDYTKSLSSTLLPFFPSSQIRKDKRREDSATYGGKSFTRNQQAASESGCCVCNSE